MINLLPQKEKQEIKKEKELKETIILGFLASFFLFSFCLILFFIKLDIDKKLYKQEALLNQEKDKFEASEAKNLEEKITALNRDVIILNSCYQNKIYLSDVFEELSGAIPPEVYLTSISYNKKDRELGILGFAPKREDLSQLKQNLENSGRIKDIYFPASNWVKSENIDFFIKFGI